ncbi:MAG: metallophosphoesterase family protein [Candidatus Aenigmatarchaeota archaeon]
MRILAVSDTHGNVESAKSLVNAVAGKKYDAVIFAGDFTSFEDVQKLYEAIMGELCKIGAPVYYVFGNRDRLFDGFGLGISAMPKPVKPIFLGEGKFEIGDGIFITGDPELVDGRTIFVSHRFGRLLESALLHIEGHIHYGIRYKNYINLGFLFRDDFHAETEGLGCYWEIEIKDGKVKKAKWHNLGIMKPLKCKVHKRFEFAVPEEWVVCPLCKGDYELEWKVFFGGEVPL